jgi:hypothetical protein
MHISKVELVNIKSHADSTFEFSRGSTAITGRNGAGKTTIRFTSDERFAAILLARYLNKIPAFEQIQGSKATLRNGETLQLIVGADWAGVRAQPRGDEDTAQLNRLADESAAGRVSATPPATASAPTTTRSGSAAPTTASGGAVTTAPAAASTSDGGIIGRPPPGVACVRY